MAWHPVHDLHWGKGGADIDDLYVAPPHRGHGVALVLLAAVSSAAWREGLTYLHGASLDPGSPVGRFYERLGAVMLSPQW